MAHQRQELSSPDDLRVLNFKQWCALTGVSTATGRRILKSPNAPTVTRLGDRRIGITVGAHRVWLERNARV
jgi:hypothetical protein